MSKSNTPDEPGFSKPVLRKPYHDLLDQIFAKAQADGVFDNLPGQGQPLKLDDDDLVPPEDRLGYRMLKTAGFAPPWVEAQRTIEQERAQLEHWLANAQQRWSYLDKSARAGLQVTYKRKLADLQRLITNFNLTAPPGVEHIEGLRMAEEIAKLGT